MGQQRPQISLAVERPLTAAVSTDRKSETFALAVLNLAIPDLKRALRTRQSLCIGDSR
jgi:hypothetical protein